MYVGGKVNYVDKIDLDIFNVDELHMFLQDLGYDPKQLMFYHYKLPNKSLDYGLSLLSCDVDVYLSPFKSTVEIEELDDDVLLNAPVVGSRKRIALCWINEADVGESSMGKNDNVNVDENLNLDDYTVHVDENINENVNVDGNVDENMNDNVNVDRNVNKNMNENVNADDEYEQDNVEDEEVIDLTDEALEVLDFNSFDSDVGDDTASITRRSLRELRKTGGQSCVQAKCKGYVPSETSNVVESGNSVSQGNLSNACGVVGKETGNSVSQRNNKLKGKSVNLVDEDKKECPWKTKAFRAKAKVDVHLMGDQEQQSALLRDYCDALKKANLNTTIKIDVYRAHNPHENVRRFKRIYVCLGALEDGFRASGRQMLGLDGDFMKGNYPGQLLSAVSVDANNEIYLVAYGIVESESKES
ncbi:hypothetical protein Tco_0738469 [Tanacetum coccineum]